MKRVVFLIFGLLTCLALPTSLEAKPKRYLKKETAANMIGMQKVFVGWVDLEPDDWALHGYRGKQEWEEGVNTLNRALLRLCQTMYLKGRTVAGAENKNDTNTAVHDLYVRFSDVRVDHNRYSLYLSIQFLDAKTNAVLGTLPMRPYYGNAWGFIPYLRAAMEEVALKLEVEITGQRTKK